jgi:uncharacterized protein (TIGR04255 family)
MHPDSLKARNDLYFRDMTESFVRPHYSRSPIAEAIIDVRTANPSAVDLDSLERAALQLATEFPAQLPIYQYQMAFQADLKAPGEGQFSNNQELIGRRLTSKSLDRVLQFQRVSFTYSHLPPYSDWKSFSEEAKRYWPTYREATRLESVSRVAVRVINHIPVPSGEVDIQAYLAVHAVVPESLPSVANAAFVQLQLSMPAIHPEARAIINVASGQTNDKGSHLVLDLDLFVERIVPSDEEMWAIIDTLGLHKDKIFEACITDKVREAIR